MNTIIKVLSFGIAANAVQLYSDLDSMPEILKHELDALDADTLADALAAYLPMREA